MMGIFGESAQQMIVTVSDRELKPDMPHNFFDTRDDAEFIEDDEGVELPDLEAARVEAATALADFARDVLPGSVRRELAVEVREGDRPLLNAMLHFEAVVLVG
jgi:hypothetical protein